MKVLYIFFIISLFCFRLNAQAIDSLTIESISDSLLTEEVNTISFLASWNYFGYGLAKINNSYLLEVSGEFVFFSKIVIIGEFGQEDKIPCNAFKNTFYTSEGEYWRLGLGYRHILDGQNFLTLTARLGQSEFKESALVYFQNESGSGEFVESYSRANQKLRWLEFVLTSEQRVKFKKISSDSFLQDFIRIGADLRYKWREPIPEYFPVEQYYIPGYGRAISPRRLSANLFIKIRIF